VLNFKSAQEKKNKSEYACPAWHTSITKDQTKSLEDIQRRALQIIIGNTPYEEAHCISAELISAG